MTTAIEDGELDAELQELYLVNKQWLSEIEFLDTELEFLRKLTTGHGISKTEELHGLYDIENTYASLKTDVLTYLRQLEPLIIAENKMLNFTLIDRYLQLKN